MPGLLVSVRTPEEARAAVSGGASVIDVKDPVVGPLGRSTPAVWAAVRAEVPSSLRVSVALGELVEWPHLAVAPSDWSGISYRKIGLAGAGADWRRLWADLRARSPGPPWIAVSYADWATADAPSPEETLDAALAVSDCVGLLVDTFDKSRPSGLDDSWFPLVRRAKMAGRLIALAGRIDRAAIPRLAPLGADLFAVRGAACVGGERTNPIDPSRVADLAHQAASVWC